MAKVMDHRIEKLSSLLDADETHQNVANINEISIVANEAGDENACSSTIKVKPLLIQKSKRFKIKATQTLFLFLKASKKYLFDWLYFEDHCLFV